ncbi:MAG: choice-of-anchor D domain-containing protein, partial [Candidatus Dormibacteraceae bacterium]
MPSRPGLATWLSGKKHLTLFAPLMLRLVLPASVAYSRSARERVAPVRRSNRKAASSQPGPIAEDFALEPNSGGFEGLHVIRPQANPGPGALSSQITVSPPSVNFGNVQVGSKSGQQVTITNTGTKTVTITQATVTGNGFSISGLGWPLKLLRGRHRTFEATFAPTVAGNEVGGISVYSNSPPSPITVPLSGTGVSGVTILLSLSPTSTNFGNVVINTPSTLPVEMINTGTGSVTITQANLTGPALSISGLSLPLTILAGKNSSFNVTFDPITTGLFNGNVS